MTLRLREIDAIIKTIWLPKLVEELNRESVVMRRIDKDELLLIGGDDWQMPLFLDRQPTPDVVLVVTEED